jgi:UDP-N-acetylglucosamine:LPS N-acetylglucosamine transferase
VNADYLAEAGAAVRLNDEDMAEKLFDTVSALILDDAQLSSMRAKSRALANPNGARRLADLLRKIGRD